MPAHDQPELHPDTHLIHAGRDLNTTSAVAPPIYQTSTFRAEDAEDFLAMATDPRHPRFYTRYGNPTQQQAEAVIAQLEGAQAAKVFSSGMAAISTAVITLVERG